MVASVKRTKILATLGPTSESPSVIADMINAGMDAVRLNLSHGTVEQAIELHRRVREVSESLDREIGTLVDLPGPKIRAGSFGEFGVSVRDGADIRLIPGNESSGAEVIEVDYEDLLDHLQPGDRVCFGDGDIDAEITEVGDQYLDARVIHGGVLTGRPGVHIPSERLEVPTPTPEDLQILDAFADEGVDMVAVSFVRAADDLRRLTTEPHPAGPLVVAKIETRTAVENLTEIIDAAGAVMVARGDLGIEYPMEDVPHLQKMIIRECIAHGRPAITATQMLQSMEHAPTPTRAEATDVVNAIIDGSSVVMLSGETAVGQDPANVVETMARLCERADDAFDSRAWVRLVAPLRTEEGRRHDEGHLVTDAMTSAATRVAEAVHASAILCLTRSGFTVRAMARFRPKTPILGFSPDERVRRQLAVSWGTLPIPISGFSDNETMVREALQITRERGLTTSGQHVVVLAGTDASSPATDVLRVLRVP